MIKCLFIYYYFCRQPDALLEFAAQDEKMVDHPIGDVDGNIEDPVPNMNFWPGAIVDSV